MTGRLHKVSVHRSRSMGITAMELMSNHSFPRHTHDEYGIGVILSGAQRSWSGVGPVESVPGDVISVNPGELHDGHPVNGAARRWRIIYFDPAALTRHFVPDAAREIEFVSPNLRDCDLGGWVNLLFNRLSDGVGQLGVEEIVIHLVRRLTPQRRPEGDARKYSTPVRKARERIDDDPSSQISLTELAALSGISRYQIVRAFARELGVTPYAYVIQSRVRLARQLLMNGDTLADTALRAGFADQSHLTRAFARQFGIPPGRYLAAGA
jgi:AraC-like DNA-binding protein